MNEFQRQLIADVKSILIDDQTWGEPVTYTAYGYQSTCITAVVNQHETLALQADSDGQCAHRFADIYVDSCDVGYPTVQDTFSVRGVLYKLTGEPEIQVNGLMKLALKSIQQYEKSKTDYRIPR